MNLTSDFNGVQLRPQAEKTTFKKDAYLQTTLCTFWCGIAVTQKQQYFPNFLLAVFYAESHLILFVEAQRIKQSQQWWRGTDLLKYLHLCVFVSPFSPWRLESIFPLFTRSLSLLRFGKWQPLRQTGALHLVNPEGVRYKTNGSGSVTPPRSTWLISHAVICHGSCSLTSSPRRPLERRNSSLTTKQLRQVGWSRQVY